MKSIIFILFLIIIIFINKYETFETLKKYILSNLGAKKCPPGTIDVLESECKTAAQSILKTNISLNVGSKKTSRMYSGIPQGCSLDPKTKKAYFNTDIGDNNGRYNKICYSVNNFLAFDSIKNTKTTKFNNMRDTEIIPITNTDGFVFNGRNSFIDINDLNLEIFSISMLVNTKNTNAQQTIFTSNSISVYIQNKQFVCKIGNNTLVNKAKLIDNKYYQVVITYNNKLEFYVNGMQNSLDIITKINKIRIGLNYLNDHPFFGIIGDIKIYFNVLSKTEICGSYNMCFVSNETNESNNSLKNYKMRFRKPAKCRFRPKGITLLSCTDRCTSVDRKKWGGDKCTPEKCDEICKDCDNLEDCHWLQNSDKFDMFLKLPKSFKIKGFADDRKIKITWINASEPDILEYYISINEQGKSSLRFNFMGDINCRMCEFTIVNLKNNVLYEIALYAKNKFGLGPPSNKLQIVPNIIENKKIESDMNVIKVDDSKNNNDKVYSTTGDIESTNNISSNEYKNVIDFLTLKNRELKNNYNFDINLK